MATDRLPSLFNSTLLPITTILSKTRDVTVHSVFSIYNTLFGHFKRSIRQLRRKKVPWKKSMLSALEAGQEKLSSYYNKTEQMHGNLYAMATILAPQHKLQFFSSKEWADDSQDWCEIYRKTVQEYILPYKQRLSDSQLLSRHQSPPAYTSELDSFYLTQSATRRSTPGDYDELEKYLGGGMYNIIHHPISLNILLTVI